MANKDGEAARGDNGRARDEALYIISVAAQLAGVHPQTLRMYERKGLLSPQRSSKNGRRYSERDIENVRLIQSLTQERGVNLAGVDMVLALNDELERTRERLAELEREVERTREEMKEEIRRVRRSQRADLVPFRASLIPYDPNKR